MPKIIRQEVKALAEELRKRYGGMMTIADTMKELGYKDRHSAERWLKDVRFTKLGVRKKWRVSDIAEKICNNTVQPL